jgi:sigma-B regulation protein RsbU (phosphoserine phosphatase)
MFSGSGRLGRQLILCSTLFGVALASAQQPSPATFDLDKGREVMLVLDGQWRFHPGDDPRWSDPAFNDSAWPLIRSDKSWSDQGYKNMSGYAWYRARVLVPAGEKPLALYIPRIRTKYQVFVDGRPLPHCRDQELGETAVASPPIVCSLPPQTPQPHSLTLAIRVWHWPHWAMYFGGGMTGGIRIGDAAVIQQLNMNHVYATGWRNVSGIVLAILEGLAAIASLALFALRPREREYLWFGLMLAVSVASRAWLQYRGFHLLGVFAYDGVACLLDLAATGAQFAFFYTLLRGRRNWLFWGAVAALSVHPIVVLFGLNQRISVALSNELLLFVFMPHTVWLLALVIRRAVEGYQDARLLLAPTLLVKASGVLAGALWIAYVLSWYRGPATWFNATSTQPFPWSLTDLTDALFLLAMLAILIYRFNRTSAQEERFALEFASARAVQNILIPETIPQLPGLNIETVYCPAAEVGGDLFQILPADSGSTLVVIGDVSGKGMPAAMTVSLIVGTLRTLAEFSDSPAEILRGLNRRLIGRSSGFTTCLILRIDQDGTCIIANAGHLAPYVNGKEVTVDCGLPLGIAEGAEYEESIFQLGADDHLTLLTDGVIEARSSTGELFGFERTAAASAQSAEHIATTAQQFGQEDDITVLTLQRTASFDVQTPQQKGRDHVAAMDNALSNSAG